MPAVHGAKGVIAPILTPFTAMLEPDLDRFAAHAKMLLAQGCTALAPFGTTGEANSLSLQERKDLLDGLIVRKIDPAKLIPGTGCCSYAETIELSRHAVERGCAGVMVLPPFYYKGISDDGLFRVFEKIIEGVADPRLRIYLYHIPAVAGVGFSLGLLRQLIEQHGHVVVGIKDSSGDWKNTEAVLDTFPNFLTFSGSEPFLLANLRKGGAGCITATANVNPAPIRALFDSWQSPNADDVQASLTRFRAKFQPAVMIPSLKFALSHYYSDSSWRFVRPPLVELDPEVGKTLIGTLESGG